MPNILNLFFISQVNILIYLLIYFHKGYVLILGKDGNFLYAFQGTHF